MTPKEAARPRLDRGVLIIAGLMALATLGVPRSFVPAEGPLRLVPYILEAAILVLLVVVVLGREDTRALWRDAPLLQRVWAGVLIVGLLVGQFAKTNSVTFPFVAWTMYGQRRVPPVPVERYYARMADGERQEVSLPRLVPKLANARVEIMLRRQIRLIKRARSDEERERRRDIHHRTLQALLALWSEETGENPVAMEVVRLSPPATSGVDPDAVGETVLWTIPAGGGAP